VRTRIADPANLEAVTGMINLAFRPGRDYIDGDRITLDAVRDLAAKGKFILMYDSDGLAGCVYIEPKGERTHLGLLSVDPGRQRSGIGSLLMQIAEEHCRNAGCRYVDLEIINLRETLPAFYRRLGYFETGTSPFPAHLTPKVPCHFVTMTKDLDQSKGAVR
jgi:GNAT superfamily N-acetyltransferase